MALFKKQKPIFKFSQAQNIDNVQISSAAELVNWVESENFYFLDSQTEGSVLVEKLDKHGQHIFVQRLQFPYAEGTDFDDLLENFYSKKPLTFDQSILNPIKSIQNVPQAAYLTRDTPDLPKDMAQLAQIGQQLVTVEDVTEELLEAESEGVVTAATKSISEKSDETITMSHADFERLQQEITAQKSEMAELRRLLTNSTVSTNQKRNVSMPEQKTDFEQDIQPYEATIEPKINETAYDDTLNNSTMPITNVDLPLTQDEVVQDVLGMIQSEFNKTLSDFIAKETAKIDAEIKELDKREVISPMIKQRMEAQMNQEIEQVATTLSQEKMLNIQEENARHADRLKQIEAEFESQRVSAISEIKAQTDERIEAKIAEEYTNQTEQLERILQGKTDELQLRQHSLNAGLKENFQIALKQFNQQHNQVIEQVEKQKNQNSPIDFADRLKQMRA
jgi:hypothetical protein